MHSKTFLALSMALMLGPALALPRPITYAVRQGAATAPVYKNSNDLVRRDDQAQDLDQTEQAVQTHNTKQANQVYPDLTEDCIYNAAGQPIYCQGGRFGQQDVGVWQDPNDPTHVTVNGPRGQAGHSDFGYFYKPEGGGTEFPNYDLSRNKDPNGNPITFPNPWNGRFGSFKARR